MQLSDRIGRRLKLQDLHVLMTQDSAGAGSGGRLRGMLAGMQVALCMVLMTRCPVKPA